MERVLDRLWIGSAADVVAPLAALGFVALVDLRDGVARTDAAGLEVHRVENRDGDPWSKKQVVETLDFIAEHVRRGKVLVACAAGMSRSASMVIGFLVRCGWDVAEAYERVRAVRPRISPVPKMLSAAVL